MFDLQLITTELKRNAAVFKSLLQHKTPHAYQWRPSPEKWNLLEIVCHLYDEEREDFRARTQHVLTQPNMPLPPINPVGWVAERNYAAQDYESKLGKFLNERQESVAWLRSLVDPAWDHAIQHPQLGLFSAKQFLANWLAHDYLHIRQINRYNFEYLQQWTRQDLSYAGNW